MQSPSPNYLTDTSLNHHATDVKGMQLPSSKLKNLSSLADILQPDDGPLIDVESELDDWGWLSKILDLFEFLVLHRFIRTIYSFSSNQSVTSTGSSRK